MEPSNVNLPSRSTSKHSNRTRNGVAELPSLRRDLIISPRTDRRGIAWFLVEDPVRHSFHRLGLAEYEMLLCLDGTRTIDDARTQIESLRSSSLSLTASQAAALVRFSSDQHWFVDVNAPFADAVAAKHDLRHWNQWIWFDRNHDWRWLDCLSGLFSKPAAFCLISLSSIALVLLSADGARFAQDAKQVFHPDRIWMIAIVWFMLKVVHELGHLTATVCIGCRPGNVGFSWMLLAPVAFVDLSDTHRLNSRRQRIVVSCAGVYFECMVATGALLLWCSGDFSAINHWLVSVAMAASVSTIVFNLNPLLRLDGYYVLAELLNRPQLAFESDRELHSWLKKWFLGQSQSDAQSDLLLLSYAIGCVAYRYALLVGLVIAAAKMYGDWAATAMIGLIAAIASTQVFRMVRGLASAAKARPALYLRCALLLSLLASPFALGIDFYRQSGEKCYGMVEYANDAPLRASCDGCLIRVLVADEQWVKAGQPLLELENLELVSKTRQAEQDAAASESRVLRFRQLKQPADEAAEYKTLMALRQRVETLQKQQSSLLVLAPCQGRVLLGDVDQRVGAWYCEGDELLRVVDPQQKRVVAAVPPLVANEFQSGDEVSIAADFLLGETVAGHVQQIASCASTNLPHPGLSAKAGGPLSVHESIESRPSQSTSAFVSAEMTVNDPLDELRPGQTVVVRSLGLR